MDADAATSDENARAEPVALRTPLPRSLPARLALLVLPFLLLASAVVLRQISDIQRSMHLDSCPSAAVVDLQPSWNPFRQVSADRIATIVTSWQAHSTERLADEVVQVDDDPCARRLADPAERPEALVEFANARTAYTAWLWWDLLAFAPLYGFGLLGLVLWARFSWKVSDDGTSAARLARSQKTIAGHWLLAASALAALACDWIENLILRAELEQAWSTARATGRADPDQIDTVLLNVAGHAKWLLALGVLLAFAIVWITKLVQTAGGWARTLPRLWVQVLVAVTFVIAVTVVPQGADAIRRWGIGQTIITIAGGVGLGVVVALTAAGVLKPHTPPEPAPPAPGPRIVRLAPLFALAALLAVIGWLAGWPGLYVPAGLLAGIAALSLPVQETWSTEAMDEAEEIDPARLGPRRSMAAWTGAIVVLGLGLGMVRVASADLFYVQSPDASRWPLVLMLAGGVLLAAVTPGAVRLHCQLIDEVAVWEQRGSTMLLVSLLVPIAVLTLLLGWPTGALTVAPFIGAIAVVIVFLTLLCLIGSAADRAADLLVGYPATRDAALPAFLRVLGFHRPPVLGLLVVWFLVASLVDPGGYHGVRVLEERAAPAPVRSIDEIVALWLGDEPLQAAEARPMVVIGASGGGIRAAFWTAAVLDCVVERDPVRARGSVDPCGTPAAPDVVEQRRRGLFLMSGISGGSLGVVEYVAEVGDGWIDGDGAAIAERWYRRRLGADFLAPSIAGLFFADAVHSLLRGADGVDRADLLERAWERRWPNGELEAGLYETQSGGDRPLLLLNGFSVEDGCRLAVSVVRTNGDRTAQECGIPDRPDTLLDATTDLSDLVCTDGAVDGALAAEQRQDIRLSTAALLSARFPFVSPSGRIEAGPCASRAEGDRTYVVDGGYREASAGAPVAEMWPVVEAAVAERLGDSGACVVPYYVQIDNGYTAGTSSIVDPRPLELTVPPAAIVAASGGQSLAARSATFRAFSGEVALGGARGSVAPADDLGHVPDQRWLQITTRAHPGTEAPLGWALSSRSQDDLQDQLNVNADEIQRVRDVLDGGDALTCVAAG